MSEHETMSADTLAELRKTRFGFICLAGDPKLAQHTIFTWATREDAERFRGYSDLACHHSHVIVKVRPWGE